MSFVISIIGCIFGCFLICPNMNIRRNIIFSLGSHKKMECQQWKMFLSVCVWFSTATVSNSQWSAILMSSNLGIDAGRRTFICKILALGILAQVVMKWTGHSNYKTMRPYIDLSMM